MRLLDRSHFEPIFVPLQGKRVALVDGVGKNVGDRMIYAATRQLLDEFEIEWTVLRRRPPPDAEIVLLFGGGNLGSRYRREVRIRRTAMDLGLPAIVLPQSCMGPERGPFLRVFVREHLSLRFFPDAQLAPDLALGFEVPTLAKSPRQVSGLFLRDDSEAIFRNVPSDGNPTKLCRTPQEYVAFAATYERIRTDILHFAISGLMAGCQVTLLPNSYHKNRGMWECWLRDLGCKWSESAL